jgi:hypothetical protein
MPLSGRTKADILEAPKMSEIHAACAGKARPVRAVDPIAKVDPRWRTARFATGAVALKQGFLTLFDGIRLLAVSDGHDMDAAGTVVANPFGCSLSRRPFLRGS